MASFSKHDQFTDQSDQVAHPRIGMYVPSYDYGAANFFPK